MGITMMRHGEHVNKSVVSLDCKTASLVDKSLVRLDAILNLTGIMKTRLRETVLYNGMLLKDEL